LNHFSREKKSTSKMLRNKAQGWPVPGPTLGHPSKIPYHIERSESRPKARYRLLILYITASFITGRSFTSPEMLFLPTKPANTRIAANPIAPESTAG
jgi:hypothetical protein